MAAKHQIVWRKPSTFMTSRVVGMYQRRYVRLPVRLLVVLERTKHVKERLVKAFWHSITHGLVRSSPCLIHIGNGTQLLNNLTLKVTTLVTMESRGEAIMTNEVIKQESGCGRGCLVSGWDGLSVPCKMVRNDQNVLVITIGHLKRQKVHAHQIHRICGINKFG